MQILPYWCISLLFGCIYFLLKVCCIFHEARCWKSRVMLTHLDARRMAICNYKFACNLHSWTCMFTSGRCSKVEYVDSLYCSKFGHLSSLSTHKYQWDSVKPRIPPGHCWGRLVAADLQWVDGRFISFLFFCTSQGMYLHRAFGVCSIVHQSGEGMCKINIINSTISKFDHFY